MSDNVLLKRGPGAILRSELLDLALVPLDMPEDRVRERCITVSQSEMTPVVKLGGVSLQDNHLLFLNCEVEEWFRNMTGETNCDGGRGFSGTGYADPDGILAAIHMGDGYYPHVGDGEEAEAFSYTLDEMREKTIEICTQPSPELSDECVEDLVSTIALSVRDHGSTAVDQMRTQTMNRCNRAVPGVWEQCVKSLIDTMTLLRRNPKSTVVDASCLFDLLNPDGPHRCLSKL
jgi:hypothetical protein